LTRDQKIVAAGAASGVATMVVAVVALYQLWPVPAGLGGIAERIGYALQWLALAVLPLLAVVANIGNNRALGEAIDPTLGREDRAMDIDRRVAANTVEQLALFAAGLLALAPGLTAEQMRIVPAAVIVFVAMRMAFWIGYRIHPLYRAFGMSSTIYLSVGLLAWAIWIGLLR
jgi:hypothetical protein